MIDLGTFRRDAPLKSYIAALLGTALLAALAGGVVGFAVSAGGPGIILAAIVSAAAVAAGAAICLFWWRGLDEAAREAHKWAWWWGGTAGTLIGGLAYIGLTLGVGPDGLLPGRLAILSPHDAARLAITTLLLCQVVGYGVAWAWWWLARSRG